MLITGTRPSLFRLAEAWKNRLLKAPEHTKILTYGKHSIFNLFPTVNFELFNCERDSIAVYLLKFSPLQPQSETIKLKISNIYSPSHLLIIPYSVYIPRCTCCALNSRESCGTPPNMNSNYYCPLYVLFSRANLLLCHMSAIFEECENVTNLLCSSITDN